MTFRFSKTTLLALSALLLLLVTSTVIVNVKVEHNAKDSIYPSLDSIPHNKVALLLGTNPVNRSGGSNTYFTTRINAAVELFNAGKVDYILASGDNHTRGYDEPTAMYDSLVAHGIPKDRIVLDYAGFRTLDSVVRAKKVFGCDSMTIISQADHCARALYIAEAHSIKAIAFPAPVRASRMIKLRLALREWLARDKMMWDLYTGKQPHFLGEKVTIALSSRF